MKDNQKELFIVVDKYDKILDYRTRYDCHNDKSLIHRVTNVAIFNDQGQLLLQKRSMNKDLYPGVYTLSATGHVNRGEDYLTAAKRETQEELGITDVSLQMIGKSIIETEFETEMTAVFTGVNNGPFTIAKDEIDSVQFFSTEEIRMKKDLTPVAISSLKMLKIL